jgi:hypothetical protein
VNIDLNYGMTREEVAMRIIIKPLGLVSIAVVMSGAFAAVAFRSNGGASALVAGAAGRGAQLVSNEKWKFYTEKGAVGNMTNIKESAGGAIRTGVKVMADQPGMQAWNLGVSNPLGEEFKNGEKLQLRFWGRSESSSPITIIMQRNVPGFPDCFKESVELTPQWREYRFEITTTTMAKWESMIAIHAGFRPGSVELVGAELVRR